MNKSLTKKNWGIIIVSVLAIGVIIGWFLKKNCQTHQVQIQNQSQGQVQYHIDLNSIIPTRNYLLLAIYTLSLFLLHLSYVLLAINHFVK